MDGTGYYFMKEASQYGSAADKHMKLDTVTNGQYTKAKISYRFCG